MTPRIVADRQRAAAALARVAAADGWQLREGFELPREPWELVDRRWCCSGAVATDTEAAAAVVAAARGAGVIAVCADPPMRGRLVDDLGRIGETTVHLAGPDPLVRLDEEHVALLDQLARGASMAEAAAALYMSVRTAERRVAAARSALGVRTTAEAVAVVAGEH